MTDKNELRAEMARYGDRQEDLAAAMGISAVSLSAKINGDRDFTQGEIALIAMRYSLTAEGIVRIFLPSLSNKT